MGLREQVYIWSGRFEAIHPRQLPYVNMDLVDQDLIRLYPPRKYPALAIGSSNGAATHLWAALGIPWLPQTLLIPVARSGCHPDEPVDDLATRSQVELLERREGESVPSASFKDIKPGKYRVFFEAMG